VEVIRRHVSPITEKRTKCKRNIKAGKISGKKRLTSHQGEKSW